MEVRFFDFAVWNWFSVVFTLVAAVSVMVFIILNSPFLKEALFGVKCDIFLEDIRRPLDDSHAPPEDKASVLRPDVPSKSELEALEADVVLIGGGTSSLVAASILSKTGFKVIVFEQHTKLGGGCHTFKKGRFEFDTGLHYVGDMSGNENFCQLLDQLTEGQLKWHPMDDRFDKIEVGDPQKVGTFKVIDIYAGYEKWAKSLNKQFPGNEKVFDKFCQLMQNFRKASIMHGFMKIAPDFVVKLVIKFSFLSPVSWWNYYFLKNADEIFYSVTQNKEVLACLRYIYGTLALPSKYLSLFLNVTVADHYVKAGGFYPKHGPSIIPYHLTRTITKNGGKCFVRSKVDSLILQFVSGCKLKCVGVNVSIAKRQAVPIKAKYVISSAGFYNTFLKMIPDSSTIIPKLCPKIDWMLQNMQPSMGALNLFVGFSSSSKDLGLSAYNTWMYDNFDFDNLFESWAQESDPWKAVDHLNLPFLYVSFPSAKDPSFDFNQSEPTATCSVITLCPYSWFEMWNERSVGKRGDQYESLKDALGRKMWSRVLKSFPQLEDKVEVFEVGTPVTSNFYLNAQNGEVYGLSHNMTRFSPTFTRLSRFQSEIQGLYLTGQDTWSCGFVPAIVTGALVCTTITKRNYLDDVEKLYK